MSNEIQKFENSQLQYAMTVEGVMAQVNAIQALMQRAMKAGEHYGVIPGTERKDKDGRDISKPSLLKPGAEKLAMMFRLSPSYQVDRRDYPGGHTEYTVTCTLVHTPTGTTWGQGVGSCSTLEGKYRYRKAEQTCPVCGKPAIIKGKREYGGGWLCYKIKGGCGEKFPDGDPRIENQSMGRVEHDNPADYWNTTLKMAKKRAFVDAMLTATAASDIFTQDIEEEDLTGDEYRENADVTQETRQKPQSRREAPRTNSSGDFTAAKAALNSKLVSAFGSKDAADAFVYDVMHQNGFKIDDAMQLGTPMQLSIVEAAFTQLEKQKTQQKAG